MPSSRPGLLALAPHRSTTAALLAGAARGRGMEVAVLPVGGVPERYAGRGDAHYYGGPHFAARVARPLGVALLEPDDGWLDGLPYAFTGRHIRRLPLSGARRLPGPLFAKPPTDKSFPAAVYGSGAELPDVAGDPLVQVASVVTWAEEFRLFLLDGEIRTGSRYAVHGLLVEACGATLPGPVVLDVGRTVPPTGPGGWAVVEANMAWFSNVYAADPGRAFDVVLRSAGPEDLLRDRDRPFRRAVPTGPAASRGVEPA
ncbi:ATP-grasp domain-containing protein [Streptomyces rhizosphaericola]|uniref:ATP-grasp domain-containing protein n=1 Tax=Streptomyces rhizosphaericola TaxID=2564098 RepID=UPI0039EF0838